MTQSPNSKEPRSVRPWFSTPPLSALKQEMNDLFENFFTEGVPGMRDVGPRVDVIETLDAIEVMADLPGYRADDVDIDVGENYMTLSGSQQSENKEESPDRKVHKQERRMTSFSRSVWLPCPVDEEKIDAQLVDGVLKVKLPKREEAKRRKVQIRSGDPGGEHHG